MKRFAYFLFIVSIFFSSVDGFSAVKKRKPMKAQTTVSSNNSIVKMKNYSSLVVNTDTGKILHQVNAHEARYPASLTKMMTLFLAFDAINSGKLHMDQRIPVSAVAARQPCSCIPIKEGDTITVKDAIYAAIIKSANNATYVLGEAIAGTASKFSVMMNNKAKELGMKKTNFVNPDGWHHPRHVSTAYDMALLSIALKKYHQKYYHMFSEKSFVFKGNVIDSHNHVMKKYRWADGLKTGYVRASGFNLATSASKPSGNLVAIVMGGQSAEARDNHMIALLEAGYKKMSNIQLAQADNDEHKRSVFSHVNQN